MVKEADHQLENHSISIKFVIQPERADIYNTFQEQIRSLKVHRSPATIRSMSLPVENGVMTVVEGDITRQKVRSAFILAKQCFDDLGFAIGRRHRW